MNQTEIKEMVINFLNKLKTSFDSVDVIEDGERVRVAISTADSKSLIGNEGANLSALNHVIKRITEKLGNTTPFTIDVNDYYEQALDAVREKARVNAERAKSFKTNIEMDPMNSYERMIVHATLADIPDVKTESSGYGRDRRVVICYAPNDTDELDTKI